MQIDERQAETRPRTMIGDLRHAVRWGAGLVGNLLVPPSCLACHAALSSHDALCAQCWRTIDFIRPPLCDRLGQPLPFAGAPDPDGSTVPLLSAAAVADPPAWNRARAVAAYDGAIRDLIHGFKYADRHDPRRLLGRWLAEAGRDLTADADVIVPVPLTRWRLMRRQFNQAAMLALIVGRVSGVPVDTASLRKTRTTPPQVGLTRDQRRRNVQGAFAVASRHRGRMAGRRVVLIDDVMTTGATLAAATLALRGAGAIRVDVLVVATVTAPDAVTI